MYESLRKVEAKYYPDRDSDSDRDLSKDSDRDSSRESSLDRDSSIDFIYNQKPKINKLKCEACNQELTQKNYHRHNQSLKHKKGDRLYNRNKFIESAKEDVIEVNNEDIEQKLDKYYPELEGIKYCDSCDMYLDNNTEHAKHMDTLKHRINVRLVNGEIIKIGSMFECVICKTTLSQYSVDQHLKTKMHLDNVKRKDLRSSFTDNIIAREDNGETEGYCNSCKTRYNNKNEHNESDEHKENAKQKKLVDKTWRDKVNELGLDHNMNYNQIMITSSNYADIKFLNVLEEVYNINPHIKFNTFDVVKYTKPTDDKLEENEFKFRLMIRQYNGPHDLDMLNSELETRMQEKEMNQSGWSMQRFIEGTMYQQVLSNWWFYNKASIHI